ncbi:MAG: DUF2461 domain-containing protein [Bacteroidales bacterium]|nr:DUF2461 domain-containing protein [Bacteroidales bacterium]
MNTSTVFNFLEQLSRNNNREWFTEHKALYLQAKEEVEKIIHAVGQQLVEIDPALQGFTEPSQVLFRIYRDVRFAKDKQLYKTHFGCFFASGGKKTELGGYYLHLQPQNSFVSGGVWCPQPAVLKKIRQEILYNTDTFLRIFNAPAFKTFFPKLDEEDMLQRIPTGFPTDFQHGHLLRHRHYTVSTPLADDVVVSDKLIPNIIQRFKAIKPFNAFLNL